MDPGMLPISSIHRCPYSITAIVAQPRVGAALASRDAACLFYPQMSLFHNGHRSAMKQHHRISKIPVDTAAGTRAPARCVLIR
jgi:hypothetical protein